MLTVSTAGAALGGAVTGESTTDVAVSAPTDVFIRDYVGDLGHHPHSFNVYTSPDIKVCNTPTECPTSQNPIIGITNYVFINLRNPGPYGSGTSAGTLHLYRSTPGGGTAWHPTTGGDWTHIGSAAVTVPAGVTTVRIPWTSVPGPGHFCLLARWVSPTDPMTSEGSVTTTNARENNNIAWRNVDSVKLDNIDNQQARPFAIGNAIDVVTRNELVIKPNGDPFQRAGGRIIVDLGPMMANRWRSAGAPGTGIRMLGETEVEIVDPAGGRISGLQLFPKERPVLTLTFSVATALQQQFDVQVAQFGPAKEGGENIDLGGVLYQISPKDRQ